MKHIKFRYNYIFIKVYIIICQLLFVPCKQLKQKKIDKLFVLNLKLPQQHFEKYIFEALHNFKNVYTLIIVNVRKAQFNTTSRFQ